MLALEEIKIATEKITDRTNLLLAILESEGGTKQNEFQNVNLQRILDQAITDLQRLSTSKEVTIKLTKPKQNLEILANPEKILQAIKFIIHNAIVYSQPKSNVKISLSANKSSTIIKFTDTGIGLTSQDKKYLFKAFKRSKTATQKWPDGFGFQLSLAQNIITNNNGTLQINSDGVNQGTNVKIVFKQEKQS